MHAYLTVADTCLTDVKATQASCDKALPPDPKADVVTWDPVDSRFALLIKILILSRLFGDCCQLKGHVLLVLHQQPLL
jgi:hypothetical protein